MLLVRQALIMTLAVGKEMSNKLGGDIFLKDVTFHLCRKDSTVSRLGSWVESRGLTAGGTQGKEQVWWGDF